MALLEPRHKTQKDDQINVQNLRLGEKLKPIVA
jgi:hypothetical protein